MFCSICVCVSLSLSALAINFGVVDIKKTPYLGQVWVSRSLSQGQGHTHGGNCWFDRQNYWILWTIAAIVSSIAKDKFLLWQNEYKA